MGCIYCRKVGILDQIAIYAYDAESKDHIITYPTFEDLKADKPDINHQLLRNIIREERWLTPHDGRIYSIISPYENKLNLMKELNAAEEYIIRKLDINYIVMRDRILGQQMQYVIAVDKKNNVAYSGKSNTEFSSKLMHIGSSKLVNRKTIAKYLDTNKTYAGYLWIKSPSRMYEGKDTINIATL
jgi:hypothetical protein